MSNLSLTTIIIIITVITSLIADNRPELKAKYLFFPYLIKTRQEYIRFLSSGFIHGGLMHLLFNMFTLYFFGRIVEYTLAALYGSTIGTILFIGFYLVGIIVASTPTYFKFQDNPHYRALGASGGVSAVVFSSILFYPLNPVCLFGIICLPGFVFALLYLMYSYYMAKNGQDNIGHDAHFYGAVFGIIFTFIVDWNVFPHFISQLMDWQGFF